MNKKTLYILPLLWTLCAMVYADDVSFKASAPSSVILDKPFQLVYTVNAQAKDLRAPELADFDILAGPFESRSSSTQFINGKRTSSFTQTYTFTLMAKKEGTFSIPAATVMVKGDRYTSNGLKIKVLPPDQSANGGNQGSSQPQNRGGNAASSEQISNDNLFIRTIVSKANVYEQECILLTYKLYTLVDVRQFTGSKFPDFNGFLQQDIELGDNNQLTYEHYNGRNYASAVLSQKLLYPQRDGTIRIEPATFEAVIRVQNRSQVRSIFDDFFDSYTNVSKTLTAPGVTVNVKKLPGAQPASYSGAVGSFNLTSSLSSTEVNTNEAVTLRLKLSGNGNIKFIKNPVIEFPAGFEVYDPKTENDFKSTVTGVTGSKTIEYLIIPRASGTYTIPAVEWTYFDTKQGGYRTLRTQPYTVRVSKTAGDTAALPATVPYVGKEDVKQLSTDIRYIYTSPVQLTRGTHTFYGTWGFWLAYLLPALLTLILFVFFRKQIKANADVTRVKNKKANKMAQRRLRVAQKFYKENKKEAFYEEVLKALWMYLSDKLAIPTANLNRDNAAGELARKGVSLDVVQSLLDLIDTCEYARYAPISQENPMSNVYDEAARLIGTLDSQIK